MRRWLSIRNFSTVMAIIMIVVPFRYLAHAAELEGVVVPDTQQVNGKILRLNGFGRRTYSIFGVHIYVASLYLEHFNTNPDEIIRSPETSCSRFDSNAVSLPIEPSRHGVRISKIIVWLHATLTQVMLRGFFPRCPPCMWVTVFTCSSRGTVPR
jgi:hypothetical protein